MWLGFRLIFTNGMSFGRNFYGINGLNERPNVLHVTFSLNTAGDVNWSSTWKGVSSSKPSGSGAATNCFTPNHLNPLSFLFPLARTFNKSSPVSCDAKLVIRQWRCRFIHCYCAFCRCRRSWSPESLVQMFLRQVSTRKSSDLNALIEGCLYSECVEVRESLQCYQSMRNLWDVTVLELDEILVQEYLHNRCNGRRPKATSRDECQSGALGIRISRKL